MGLPIVWVDDNYTSSTQGWGYDHFDTIQEGINATASTGTVFVYNGTYEKVVIDKPVTLIGENKTSTVIDGGGVGNVIIISADSDWVTITGFTIQNGDSAGICVRSMYNTISGNTITRNIVGVFLSSSSNNTISDNTIANNSFGIYLDSSTGSTISGNTLSTNSLGINLRFSSDNTIMGNTVSYNDCGISFVASSGNDIKENILMYNTYGITLFWLPLGNSDNNHIYHNNFINNTEHAYDEYTNIWDNDYPSGGNYWDDYEERYPDASEVGDSGIWDTPYDISPSYASNKDRYPLMEQT
jgi:parallel beta-helix repeat protein